MANDVLDTVWRVMAEPEVVWTALIAVEEWPAWWRGVAGRRTPEGGRFQRTGPQLPDDLARAAAVDPDV
ncbi:MAG: hypothetical protein IPL59_04935 [Candidatus Competibacteraceae bacterium]|nr:hypothetical protein [Candidatus Competibacteraceae bacterium]MBK8755084.1 hypothetical protein [Candidatus Competibacteraceae bacterium]